MIGRIISSKVLTILWSSLWEKQSNATTRTDHTGNVHPTKICDLHISNAWFIETSLIIEHTTWHMYNSARIRSEICISDALETCRSYIFVGCTLPTWPVCTWVGYLYMEACTYIISQIVSSNSTTLVFAGMLYISII